MNKLLRSALLAALIAAPTAIVYAQDNQSALPAATTVGDVTYLSGGIGIDESSAMKDAAAHYPLELVFSAKEGSTAAYIADVHVVISDHAGKTLVDIVSNGPYMLMTLPDGSYQVEASSKDVSKKEQVTVKKGTHKRLVFSWAK